MKNNGIKIVTIVTILILIVSCTTISLCYNPQNLTGTPNTTEAQNVVKQANKIIGIVQVIATTIAIITLIYLGVKYMAAAPTERADVKKSAAIYITGAVLLFATTGILQIIQSFSNGIGPTTAGRRKVEGLTPSMILENPSEWSETGVDGIYKHRDGTEVIIDGDEVYEYK